MHSPRDPLYRKRYFLLGENLEGSEWIVAKTSRAIESENVEHGVGLVEFVDAKR